MFYIAVLAAGVERYAGPFPIHIHYHFTLAGKPLDITNHAYMVKLIEDGLVHAKVIPGDEQKFVSGVTISAEKGEEDRVAINIEPTANAIASV